MSPLPYSFMSPTMCVWTQTLNQNRWHSLHWLRLQILQIILLTASSVSLLSSAATKCSDAAFFSHHEAAASASTIHKQWRMKQQKENINLRNYFKDKRLYKIHLMRSRLAGNDSVCCMYILPLWRAAGSKQASAGLPCSKNDDRIVTPSLAHLSFVWATPYNAFIKSVCSCAGRQFLGALLKHIQWMLAVAKAAEED